MINVQNKLSWLYFNKDKIKYSGKKKFIVFLVNIFDGYSSLNRKFRGDNWCGFRYPDHVNQFTPKTLSEMVVSTGYQIIKFNFLDKQPTSDNMWMVAKAKI